MTSRRSVLASALAAATTLASATTLAVSGCATSASRERRRLIGHTGITWGYSANDAPNAIRDVSALGFHGFESFGSVLEAWDSRGGLGDLLKAQQLPLIGAYCPMVLTDPSRRAQEVEKAVRWGRLIRKNGGHIAVIGPDNLDRQRFDFSAQRTDIIATLNDIGRALADIGVTGAVHPHTGSSVMTRDEVWAVMESVDTRHVKLCPDTGELLAAGVDPMAVIARFGDLIAHVHVKDYDGGAHHDGYTPVGLGKLELAAVMNALEKLRGEFAVMVELNPDVAANRADPVTPRRAAVQARSAFETLGYPFGTLRAVSP